MKFGMGRRATTEGMMDFYVTIVEVGRYSEYGDGAGGIAVCDAEEFSIGRDTLLLEFGVLLLARRDSGREVHQ